MMKKFLAAAVPTPPRAEVEPELDALRKQVAELEARLEKRARGKRASRQKQKGRV
jgi:hypothetical protein